MVKKQLIVMTRYPVSFVTSFAMVFIFMLIFIFAIAMFTPAHVDEWSAAGEISGNPLLLAEHHNNTTYIAFQAETNRNAWFSVMNCSYPVGNYEQPDAVSRYGNGTWSIEIKSSYSNNMIYASFTSESQKKNWSIDTSSLPDKEPVLDGNITYDKTESGRNFAGIAFYGFIFFMFLQDITWMIGYSLRDEQYQGTLESLYQTPANQFSNLISRVFLNVVWTGLNVVVALLIVVYIFGSLPAANVGFALFVLFLALMQMFGMGFIFAALTLRYKGSMDFVMNFIGVIFTFTCAMMFPFSVLPKAMVDYVSRWIPLSYAVDLFRSALLSYPSGFPELAPAWIELIISGLFAVIMPSLGYFLYWKIERSAKMNGTLSEY